MNFYEELYIHDFVCSVIAWYLLTSVKSYWGGCVRIAVCDCLPCCAAKKTGLVDRLSSMEARSLPNNSTIFFRMLI